MITYETYIGNDIIVAKIRKLISDNKLPRQILFSGISGIGKTSLANIIASELDAYVSVFNVANLTGIDSVRKYIIEEYKKIPLDKDKNVFILDEIHKLSAPAQECLLTPLEADTRTYFIACTTEPNKIKKTLLKRFTCFKLVSPTADERRCCSVQVGELNSDVRNHIVRTTIDLRTVTKLTELCVGHTLKEAQVLCAAYSDEDDAFSLVKILQSTHLDRYYPMLKKYGEDGGNWQTFLMILINYYTVVFASKGTPHHMTQPILPGTEKARVYYLISQIEKALLCHENVHKMENT